jgi:LysR family nitrogen assimilation transcriptional regulator
VRGTGAGRFAIGLPFTIAGTIGTDLVASLRKEEPSANIAVVQGRSHFLMESLCAGTIDIAIMFKPDSSPLIETTPLVCEELFLMASAERARALLKKAPLPIESLSELPLISPGSPNAIRLTVEEAVRKLKLKPSFAMEIDNIETIVDLVANGQGFAVLSRVSRALSAHGADVVPIPFAEPGLKVEICMAVSTRGSVSQANSQLVRLAGKVSRQLLEEAARRRAP